MRRLLLLLPGDPDTPTGGYIYDRRLAAGLRAMGWQVDVRPLDGDFPHPSPKALADALRTLSAIPDGSPVLVDGLALGAMPEVTAAHAHRLQLAALVHHPLAEETGLAPGQAARLRENERRALAPIRRVIVTSTFTGRLLAGYGVPPERVRVVEPGTDPAPAADGSGGPGLALLCVAALVPRKGHDLLLEALAPLADRDWHLSLAGSPRRDPATAAKVKRRVAELGLSARVTLTGEVSQEHLSALYQRADLFVLATRFEGYGMALTEALARGLPVVSTRAGAVPETVPEGAGLLVPPGDREALRGALAQLIDDPARLQQLAAGALTARARLPTWEDAARRMAAVLTEEVP